MQQSLDEIREFLKAATGGRFGAPSLVNSTFDIAGMPANGKADAPLTLIEISDYHCPFCRRHVQQTQPQIYSELVEHRQGAARVRPLSDRAAASRRRTGRTRRRCCANDQGKFWELHAKLFETPLKTAEQLIGLAQNAGLDATAFRACLESGKHAKEVQASVERIAKMNVNGTPMFLLGERPSKDSKVTIAKVIEGAQPYEAFKMAVDEVLAGK